MSRSRAVDGLVQAWRASVELGRAHCRSRSSAWPSGPASRCPMTPGAPHQQPESTVAADLGLTPREVEVLGQLAAGRTDREIADLLVHQQEDGERARFQPAAEARRDESDRGRPDRAGPRLLAAARPSAHSPRPGGSGREVLGMADPTIEPSSDVLDRRLAHRSCRRQRRHRRAVVGLAAVTSSGPAHVHVGPGRPHRVPRRDLRLRVWAARTASTTTASGRPCPMW